MVVLSLKTEIDPEKAGLCLGYKKIALLFNAGPFPGGGDCLFVEADGKTNVINSNDLIADMEFYDKSNI